MPNTKTVLWAWPVSPGTQPSGRRPPCARKPWLQTCTPLNSCSPTPQGHRGRHTAKAPPTCCQKIPTFLWNVLQTSARASLVSATKAPKTCTTLRDLLQQTKCLNSSPYHPSRKICCKEQTTGEVCESCSTVVEVLLKLTCTTCRSYYISLVMQIPFPSGKLTSSF